MKNIDKLVGREIYGTETSGVLRRNYLKTGSGQLQSVDESGKGTSVKQFFRTVFLPQGYPESVSGDYLEYQVWDTIQAFCSSITGALATQALLKGAGVGDDTATVLAATLTWLMKDGTGMVGRIIFTWMQGTYLDSDCKRWRLFADILNDAAICLEILAPFFQTYFRLIVCTAGLAKSIVGVAGGATRAALTLHQARRNNMADVSAKDGSQETLVNLTGLLFNLLVIPMVGGHYKIIGCLFLVFTSLHLFTNYRAVRAVRMEMLNQARLHVLCQHYLGCSKEKEVLSVKEGNYREPVIFKTVRRFSIHLGSSMQYIFTNLLDFEQLSAIYSDCKFIINVDLKRRAIYIVLETDASVEDQLTACFEAEILEFSSNQMSGGHAATTRAQWQNLLLQNVTEAFRHGDTLSMLAHTHKLATHGLFSHFHGKLKDEGWKTNDALLAPDEWRAVWDASGLPNKKTK